jgi:hypothetical protein
VACTNIYERACLVQAFFFELIDKSFSSVSADDFSINIDSNRTGAWGSPCQLAAVISCSALCSALFHHQLKWHC